MGIRRCLMIGVSSTEGLVDRRVLQALIRFMADVVALHPRAVHMMVGTNDIAGNTGPTDDLDFENNVRAMVEIAHAGRIKIILAAIPPMASLPWAPDIKPIPRVSRLNEWLERYAQATKAVFVDYGSVVSDGAGGLKPSLSNDGVHPNRNGYAAMAPLARCAIARALATNARVTPKACDSRPKTPPA